MAAFKSKADVERLEAEFEASEIASQRKAANVVKADDYRDLSFDDAIAKFEADYGTDVVNANDVLGDGFPVIDKDELVNRPLVLINWMVSRPENERFGNPYIVAKGITKDGTKFRITDGSVYGLAGELVAFAMKRASEGHPAPNGGLVLERGLKRDEVTWTNEATGESGVGRIYRTSLS